MVGARKANARLPSWKVGQAVSRKVHRCLLWFLASPGFSACPLPLSFPSLTPTGQAAPAITHPPLSSRAHSQTPARSSGSHITSDANDSGSRLVLALRSFIPPSADRHTDPTGLHFFLLQRCAHSFSPRFSSPSPGRAFRSKPSARPRRSARSSPLPLRRRGRLASSSRRPRPLRL